MTTQIQRSSFADTVKRLERTMEEARNQAKMAFLQELKAIFDRNPELKVIKWVQYTPYFNDGDTCEFTVHDIVAANYEEVDAWGEWEGEDDQPHDFTLFTGYRSRRLPDLIDLESFMESSIGYDVLQFAFGDHVQVTVTVNGVTVDDYDHE
jgi:hypothetical protein